MASISAANSLVFLGVTDLFPVAQQMIGFSADDIFSSDGIDTAEVQMGVDGILSAGFVYVPVQWTLTLQADSPSIAFFDALYGAEQVAGDKFFLFGNVTLPGLSKTWAMLRGVVTNLKIMPDAKKTLQPQAYQITWERILPAATI